MNLKAFDKDFGANADEFDLVASPSNTPPVAPLSWKPKLNQAFLILNFELVLLPCSSNRIESEGLIKSSTIKR